MGKQEREHLMKSICAVFDADEAVCHAEDTGAAESKIHFLLRQRLDAIEIAVTAGCSYDVISRITGAAPETIRVAIQRRRKAKRDRLAKSKENAA